jgi:hypothetical protein
MLIWDKSGNDLLKVDSGGGIFSGELLATSGTIALSESFVKGFPQIDLCGRGTPLFQSDFWHSLQRFF